MSKRCDHEWEAHKAYPTELQPLRSRTVWGVWRWCRKCNRGSAFKQPLLGRIFRPWNENEAKQAAREARAASAPEQPMSGGENE